MPLAPAWRAMFAHAAQIVLLLAPIGTLAAPSHYFQMHATDAVRAHAASMRMWAGSAGGAARDADGHRGGGARRLASKQPRGDAVDCGSPPSKSDPADPMWFTQAGCSLASMDNYSYLDEAGAYRTANKGELIQAECDDVFCPIPVVPDCYTLPGICAKDEFCFIDQHEKWGPWAMGRGGATPSPSMCGDAYLQTIADADVTDAQRAALNASRNAQCTSDISYPGDLEVWKPIHGTCVRYRQLQQSCIEDPLTYTNPAFDSPFFRAPDGKAFVRPLVCDPKGGPGGTPLTCTGPDFEVLPSTCVQARPPNQCFSGPWWDSKDCPRTSPGAPKAGLSRELALGAGTTAMLLFAGEVGWPATCVFWDKSQPIGRATEAARRRLYAIVGTLWPEDVIGKPPSYDTLMAPLNVSTLTDDMDACYENESVAGSPQAGLLGALGAMAMQPNKIWSMVHFLMHNQPSPMSAERVQASAAMANFLLDYFWCDDCRGFFYGGIVSVYGMPPDKPDPEAHAKWWWWAHNVASEHVATTRGGHPWIHQAGAPDVEKYQNPYFMRWEDAVKQWHVAASDS